MSDDNNDEMAQMFAGSRFAAGCRVDMSGVNAEEIAFGKRVRLAQRERERSRQNQRDGIDSGVAPTVTMVAGELDRGAKSATADLAIEPGPER